MVGEKKEKDEFSLQEQPWHLGAAAERRGVMNGSTTLCGNDKKPRVRMISKPPRKVSDPCKAFGRRQRGSRGANTIGYTEPNLANMKKRKAQGREDVALIAGRAGKNEKKTRQGKKHFKTNHRPVRKRNLLRK